MKTTLDAAAEVKATRKAAAAEVKAIAIEVASSMTQVAAEARGQVSRQVRWPDRAAVVHGRYLPVPSLP